MKHVRWLDESGMDGPGHRRWRWTSTSRPRAARRACASCSPAFGASEGWDDLFDGTEIGWTYFLYNLRVYLEKHLGPRAPHDRRAARVARRAQGVLEAPAGRRGRLVVGGTAAIKAGDTIELKLAEPATVRAVVEVVVEGHALGLRIAELADALLFIELEGKGDEFHVGYWLSVYDDAQARALETPARRAFQRVHENFLMGNP